MILYLVYDKKNNTTTAPAVAPDFQEVQLALRSIYPENIDDLVIHELLKFDHFYDLYLLDINSEKSLPDFLINRSALDEVSATQQAEGAVGAPDVTF